MSRSRRRKIRQHLRYHLGNHIFGPEKNIMLLCEGDTAVSTFTVPFSKVSGEKPEMIRCSIKNMAREAEEQIGRCMSYAKMKPQHVERIDLVTGGDHGQGALQQGVKCTITTSDGVELEGHDDDDIHSFSLQMIIAEAICGKDTGELLKATPNDKLSAGMKEIADEKLTMTVTDGDEVRCRFVLANESTEAVSLKVIIYVVSNLAFYGMILGREDMMGAWCYACQLSHTQFQDLFKRGEPWTWEAIQNIAAEIADPSFKGDRKMGVKTFPLWPFIPFGNILVPLLQCLLPGLHAFFSPCFLNRLLILPRSTFRCPIHLLLLGPHRWVGVSPRRPPQWL